MRKLQLQHKPQLKESTRSPNSLHTVIMKGLSYFLNFIIKYYNIQKFYSSICNIKFTCEITDLIFKECRKMISRSFVENKILGILEIECVGRLVANR